MLNEKDIYQEEKFQNTINFQINYYAEKLRAEGNISDDLKKKYEESYELAIKQYHETETIEEKFRKEGFKEILNGNKEWLSFAIKYLEIDPFYSRSGYLKEEIIKCIKKISLDIIEKKRLQNVIINVVKKRYRRELYHYRKLALSVLDDHFLEKLKSLNNNEDTSENAKKRVNYILEYISKNKK